MVVKLVDKKIAPFERKIMQYKFSSKKAISRDRVEKEIKKLFRKREKANYQYMVTTLYPQAYRSSAFNWYDQIRTYRVEDHYDLDGENNISSTQDKINEFYVYVRNADDEGGKDDDMNDCLHNSMLTAISGDYTRLKMKWMKYPDRLKKWLGLKRDAKISIDCLKKIEKHGKCSFTVVGDHMYESRVRRPLHFSLELSDGHYKCIKGTAELKQHPFPFHDCERLMTYKKLDDGNFIGFNGHKTKRFSREKRNGEYMRMDNDKYTIMISCSGDDDLETKYREYKNAAILFKLKVEDLRLSASISMLRSSFVSEVALRYFFDTTKCIAKPEPISVFESACLDRAFRGGLNFHKPGQFNKAVEYDVNSMYPHYMSSSRFKIPITEGKKMLLTEYDTKLFGLFHIHLKTTHPMLCISTGKIWVTHHDMSRIGKFKCKYSLVSEVDTNAIVYDTFVDGKTMFGPFVNRLTSLKDSFEKGSIQRDFAKKMMQSIWGKLATRDQRIRHFKEDQLERIDTGFDIAELNPISYKIKNTFRPFKSDHARLSIFLTAFCRREFTWNVLHKFPESAIVKIVTDSVTVYGDDIDISHLKISTDMGDMKVEKTGNIEIVSLRNTSWN